MFTNKSCGQNETKKYLHVLKQDAIKSHLVIVLEISRFFFSVCVCTYIVVIESSFANGRAGRHVAVFAHELVEKSRIRLQGHVSLSHSAADCCFLYYTVFLFVSTVYN